MMGSDAAAENNERPLYAGAIEFGGRDGSRNSGYSSILEEYA